MSATQLKIKIQESLEEMDEQHLHSAYLILRELANQQKHGDISLEKDIIEEKITRGIEQLNNGEGTDFKIFLEEIKENYGRKE